MPGASSRSAEAWRAAWRATRARVCELTEARMQPQVIASLGDPIENFCFQEFSESKILSFFHFVIGRTEGT